MRARVVPSVSGTSSIRRAQRGLRICVSGVCQRITSAAEAQRQRPQLAAGDRSHSCRNLDCDRLAGHVGLLPPHAPTTYNGRVVPANCNIGLSFRVAWVRSLREAGQRISLSARGHEHEPLVGCTRRESRSENGKAPPRNADLGRWRFAMKQSNPNEGRAVRRIILSVASALAISAIAAGEPLGHLFAPGGHRRRWSGTIASWCPTQGGLRRPTLFRSA